MNDQELIDALKPFGSRGLYPCLGMATALKTTTVAPQLVAAGLDVKHRDLSHHGKSSPSVHNKFVVESDAAGKNASRVLTGSTNWTTTGLCTQMNNVLIIEDAVIASRYLDQWGKLVAAGDDMPASLIATNSIPTNDNNISLYFAATNKEAKSQPVLELIAGAQEGALFLMFMPGQSPLLEALLGRSQQNDIYVRGVISTMMPTKNGDIVVVGGQVVKSGAPAQAFHDNVQLPAGVSAKDHPSWEETEFNVQEIHAAHMMAIVHSKAIVIDPFSDQCAVITGSHNFSVSASEKNDENLVIVRGNRKLAQAYALHINGVYDHYSWRAFLGSGGDADQIYKPLDGWKPGGSRAQELDFWMNEPIPPQSTAKGASSAASGKKQSPAAAPKVAKKSTAARTAKKATPVKAAKKSTTKKAGRQQTKANKSTAKKSKAKTSKKKTSKKSKAPRSSGRATKAKKSKR